MGTICLISPGHLSTNPRLVKEADALSEAGYDVHVICGEFQHWSRSAEAGFAGRKWRSITRVPFGPGSPPAVRIRQVAWEGVARQLERLGVRHKAVLAPAWHQVAPDLARAAKAIVADLYVAHYVSAIPAAAEAARFHGARYAFDAEDFHFGDPPEGPEFDETRRRIRTIESTWLPGAAYVTAASPGIARAYTEAYGIPTPTVLLNVFPRANAPAIPSARGQASPGPSVYWFSQTVGRDRGLEIAARAIGLARSRPHLYLRGSPQVGFEEELCSIAAESGAAGNIHFLPPGLPSEMERLAANHDIGIVSETGVTLNRRIALTNKLFTFALAGIPAVISDIPAHREFAQFAGTSFQLYPVDDPGGLAQAIDGFLLGGGAPLAQSRAQAHSLGQLRLNWDVEKALLTGLVAEALA